MQTQLTGSPGRTPAGGDPVLREGLLRAELCPPNSYAEVLTPSTSECDLIWRQGVKEVIKLK